MAKKKTDICKNCKKEIPFKTGVYRGYCGYDCYVEYQKKNKKITDYF